MEETREELIARLEESGQLDPSCQFCQREFYSKPNPAEVFAPSHKALSTCRSGKRPHCTCDSCF